MRGATECAKRVKLLLNSLRAQLGKVTRPAVGDPITQMLLGILSRNVPEAKAAEGLDRLRGMVVDFNELRVIPPIELAEVLGDFPDARLKCEDISRSLNAIFAIEHTVALDRAAEMPKRDAAAYLDKVDGLEAYTRARVRLLGFGQHAFPLDEAMWALSRREELVAPKATLEEAQQFFERQVAEDDTVESYCLLKKHAWNEMGGLVKKGEVERILSIPPDRSARNMLQMISMAAGIEEPEDIDPDDLPPELMGDEEFGGGEPAEAPRKPKAAARKSDAKEKDSKPAKAGKSESGKKEGKSAKGEKASEKAAEKAEKPEKPEKAPKTAARAPARNEKPRPVAKAKAAPRAKSAKPSAGKPVRKAKTKSKSRA